MLRRAHEQATHTQAAAVPARVRRGSLAQANQGCRRQQRRGRVGGCRPSDALARPVRRRRWPRAHPALRPEGPGPAVARQAAGRTPARRPCRPQRREDDGRGVVRQVAGRLRHPTGVDRPAGGGARQDHQGPLRLGADVRDQTVGRARLDGRAQEGGASRLLRLRDLLAALPDLHRRRPRRDRRAQPVLAAYLAGHGQAAALRGHDAPGVGAVRRGAARRAARDPARRPRRAAPCRSGGVAGHRRRLRHRRRDAVGAVGERATEVRHLASLDPDPSRDVAAPRRGDPAGQRHPDRQ